MSVALYATALYWDAYKGRGYAKHNGVELELTQAPDIGVPDLVSLHFAPCVRSCELQTKTEARRDMTATEKYAARALLEQISTTQGSTP